ncbi:uncharacterized protein GVI51_C05269 [Nakaseomyces glabratus]|uniref:GTPase-activating protein GYP7 n=2 Tax=Candida glabrata TaxID=5478 RepID=GYP7_CANGA|nr:uncharacterized protein CAGL0C05489g [Nakaseomyces glabratus]Q6FWI1.1 RecName: Full=GTPase-activating protein GYP7; AltName: Full=GAP for YPT7 [Nakaseomyces glabratus CBS 138]KAH7608753.1 TBC/rab GAP domain profile [Nakaseomyces glabratus]KAH7609628.1 TBC/rab GAP domain profile [Nakaseomyces glabratus]KTA96120.1 GTPase-activating protein GYP7 [Nakaseomyces glabratus]KTA99350.1 GTPase-activating protein GYP7 [Nakaseomyces glabratus]KTB01752.1 GTPase-activating protein GYP7 [Nakaseomyces gla|eukprot:XP_445413.1 uncharacterized protein CAGL0C05489g [[Candida] glabrata]
MSIELLFCKSQVYIHPTKNLQDNVSGYLLITHQSNSETITSSTISWIPENSLNEEDINFLNNAETRNINEKILRLPVSSRKLNTLLGSGSFLSSNWQFTIPVLSLYSVQFKLPNTWWYGSCILYSKSPRETESIPVLYFHDDLCPSTISKQKELNRSFDPFNNSNEMYWGGQDFKDALGSIVELKRVESEPTFWLVNATLEDLRNFSSANLKSSEEKPSSSKDDGVTKLKEDAWQKWESTKWSLMSQFADITAKTGSFVGSLIKKHPVVQLVERNKNNYYVQKMLKNPKVVEIQDDFDSAKIYLAKWALSVKEEAERYQEGSYDNPYRRILVSEFGLTGNEDVSFTEEELNRAMERNHPMTKQKWNSLFDSEGRLTVTVNEVKDYIFHGGLADDATRKEVWPFLLGVYPWDSSEDERKQLRKALHDEYMELKQKWVDREVNLDNDEEEYWKDQLFRIEKDVKRNDRNIDIYKYNTSDNLPFPEDTAPTTDDDDSIKNPNLKKLADILTTYNIFNPNLGYVQGMTDLLSPLYYIIRDEETTFWCFTNFMERMERNFLRDQSGIRDQMLALTDLCQLMLPRLSAHLQKCDSSDLFFCFRMLLVWFKREFNYDDIFNIWEVFFTDFYSSQYQLFFMLAILQKNSSPIVNNLQTFDQVIKYFNDLNSKMNWRDLMVRSELLFIQFHKTADLLARRQEQLIPENSGHDTSDIEGGTEPKTQSYISEHLQTLLSKEVIIQKENTRTKDSIK